MRINVHWKLTFVFFFLITLILFITYFYLNKNLSVFLENRLQDNLKKELFLSKKLIETNLIEKQETLDWDSLADEIGKLLELRVTLVDLKGVVLGDSELNKKELEEVESHLSRPEIQSAIKEGFGQSKRFSSTLGKDMLYVAMPFGKPEPYGIVRLSLPVLEVELLEANLKKIVLLSIFLVFILSALFSFLLAKMVSRPILRMSNLAKEIAKGNYPHQPLFYAHDEIGELAKSLQQMSEEIRNKIAYISSEEAKLKTVLSSIVEGLMVMDKKGEVVLVNDSLRKMFCLDAQIMGKRPLELIRNNKVQKITDGILKEGHRFLSDEIEVNFPQEKIVRINGTPIIKNGEIEGVVIVFHDITELKRLEKIRQDFVANVSHELRTPLTSIKGYAETLLEGALEDKKNAKEFLEIIYRDAERLSRLIDDLLDLSRIESGKLKMHFSKVDLAKIIKHSLRIMDEQLNNRNITVELNLPENLSPVLADEARITQVMLNLLDNAIKYNVDRGKIEISVLEKDNFMEVNIKDTGIGIPEKDLLRLFERFYRVDKARSRELGGTGLGLSIVKHIVQAHQGEVFAKSEFGKGSTFSFTLPKA
ncbi:MAG: cell wall metabolism sensor histidine kinase WalK [Candidatus Omnitrophica bacterium]|nr:cell wall metabolism sensor histidine kinase WalK [Candidatus Omnitrophota bacterium]